MIFFRSLFFLVGWLFMISWVPLAYGQQQAGGLPRSFSAEQPVGDVVYELMPPVDVFSLQQEDAVVDTIRDIPWRFGENISVAFDLQTSGSWDVLEHGDRIWRLGIYSPGALSINLTFDRFRLPPGASMYLYNQDRSFVLGAFTERNNQDDMYFATTMVPGDVVIVEYVEPADAAFHGELSIETVTHAYRSVVDYSKRFRASGPCHLNVACPEAAAWGDEADGVMLMMVGSNSLCTGSLINNVNNDARPYILAANHCYRNPSTLVFWFNWQSATCQNPDLAPSYSSMSGAISRVRSTVSDVWLLELNEPVPLEYNPYFMGWNRTLDLKLQETVATIHHPRGDIKKFSYALGGTEASGYILSPGSGTTHWHVVWSGGTSTEPASSGAPLLDQSGRIIGQLHGGYAACGNQEPDWFGRFGISWSAGQSEGARLREWLDPNNTDVQQMPGLRPADDPVSDVTAFNAVTTDARQITLNWSMSSDHHVLIAMSETEQFGQPAGSYTLGESIAGGGRVMYMGNDQAFVLEGLNPATTYYFKAWSFSALNKFSSGVESNATTSPLTVSDFPYAESMDDTLTPNSWEMTASASQHAWKFGKGNGAGNPALPYRGDNNAYFYPASPEYIGAKAMLISPTIDFSAYDRAQLAFYYTNTVRDTNQDTLRVYYSCSEDEGWELLATMGDPAGDWTKAIMDLPALDNSCRIGLEATWLGGYGICVDELQITAGYNQQFPAPRNLAVADTNIGTISLVWELPEAGENLPQLTGFVLHRNGEPLVELPEADITAYGDDGLAIGTYSYTVTALYESPDGTSEAAGPVAAVVSPTDQVYSLQIEIAGHGSVHTPFSSPTLAYNQGVPATIRAQAGAFAVFRGWYEEGSLLSSDTVLTLVMDRDYSVLAQFAEVEYQVMLTSEPDSLVVLSGEGFVKHGLLHTVSTSVPFGWRFRGWRMDDALISTSRTFQFAVTANMHLTAWYDVYNYIELAVDPPAGGMARGSGLYAGGQDVTLRAYANPGWVFSHWEFLGEPVSFHPEYSFVAGSSMLLTAVFEIPKFSVEAVASHPDAAEITGAGLYAAGETATLTIVYDDAWRFLGWYEDTVQLSTRDTLSFVVDKPRSIVARLEPKFVGLTIEIEGHGTTIPEPGSYTFEKGASVSLSASPDRGWRFRHWVINEEIFTDAELEIFLDTPVTARAVFFFATSADPPESGQRRLIVYPNPGSGFVHVLLPEVSGNISLDVYDLSGHHLLRASRSPMPSGQGQALTSLDLRAFGPGVYLLRVSGTSIMYHTRVVVY